MVVLSANSVGQVELCTGSGEGAPSWCRGEGNVGTVFDSLRVICEELFDPGAEGEERPKSSSGLTHVALLL